MNFFNINNRKTIPKHTKFEETEKSFLVNSNQKKLYDYFLCDYCGSEIEIKKKNYEMSGGIVVIPQSLTKNKSITLVLHNACLNHAVKELEGLK